MIVLMGYALRWGSTRRYKRAKAQTTPLRTRGRNGIGVERQRNHNNNYHLQEVSAIKKESAYQLMFKDYPDVVNATQMCEMLGGISIKTGYELLKSGKVKSFLVGRSYRIPKLFILEYMGL